MRIIAKKLGDMLVEQNICTREAINSAIEYGKSKGLRIGQALAAKGIVDERTIIKLVSEQQNIPWVDIDMNMREFVLYDNGKKEKLPINVDILKRHNDPEFFRSIMAVPLMERNNIIYLAATDPNNAYTLADLDFFYGGMEVRLALATRSDIEEYLVTVFEKDKLETQLSVTGNVRVAATTFDLDSTDNAPINNAINSILQNAILQDASDVHIEVVENHENKKEIRIRFRVDGKLQTYARIQKEENQVLALANALAGRIKIMANINALEKRMPQDGKITTRIVGRMVDMRVNTMPTVNGEKIAIRLLDKTKSVLRLENLEFQPDTLDMLRSLIRRPTGMILLTGPTGSGKTTTVYASITEINDATKNIITVEDPPEYSLIGINQAPVNHRTGFGFDEWFRAALRQDPDIIYFGEIRDKQTASTAISASLTGHLVLTTLHTNNAPSAIARLLDLGIEPFLVVSAVTGVLSQRLVRRVCPKCYVEKEIILGDSQKISYRRGNGCRECNYTGYRGRLAIQELLSITPTISEAVLKRATTDELMKIAKSEGMRTLYEDGIVKVENANASLEDVLLNTIANVTQGSESDNI